MKRTGLLILLFLQIFILAADTNPETSPVVQQDILYVCKDASEVYLVWGINNWALPEESLRPEGSFVKDKLLFTPMKQKGNGFVASLKVLPNTMVDYVFWISGGPAKKPVDLWDLNVAPQKDYHTWSVSSNMVMVNSKVNVRPKEPISVLDFAVPILSICTTLMLLFFIIKTSLTGDNSLKKTPFRIICAGAFVTSIMLVFIRSSVTGQSWDLYLHPFAYFPKVLWSGFYDVFYILILSALFILLATLLRKYRRILAVVISSYIFICLFSIVAGIMNIRVIATLGKPFNYPWFYYSDFLQSSDSQAAMSANVDSAYFLQIAMVCLASVFAAITILLATEILVVKYKMKHVLTGALTTICLAYIIIAPGAVRHYNWDYTKLANPIIAFAGSMPTFSGNPELFTMNVNDSLKFELFLKKNTKAAIPEHKIKNVVLFVMESTPAEYVQPYANEYKITPELEKHLNESIVFDNIYAHAPATNNSMVSILGSVYPWLSYNSITKEHPDVQLTTISSELKRHGYRTAFFNSADNRFQKAGEFLSNRKFDNIKDCNSINCEKGFEVNDEHWDFLNGKDDACTGGDLFSWISESPEKPFFGMMWTYQTHFPYFSSGEEITYNPTDRVMNRYLNAVHHSDQVLGKLLDDLKAKGLSESTLVVVVGDHGEAFGRHSQVTHAGGIYEENLHVPFILINPAFKGERKNGIGGLVDIAPTLMNILGYAPSEYWQGKDLFTAKETDRVYFFTPWADYLFGYREGNYKYIFNATKNISEMYDLKADPHETNNIASQFPEKTEISHQRIAGWVQSLDHYMNTLLTAGK
ncbi:MAG: Lipoteichoic acid synthase 2 [Bacteroidota bacterium]|jgi:arylsulfatase A-like enzyme|nr:Lipoteichoic acid synthase 2 [Bacteroidota bacterium]